MVIAILGTIVILELLAISWLIRQGGRARFMQKVEKQRTGKALIIGVGTIFPATTGEIGWICGLDNSIQEVTG